MYLPWNLLFFKSLANHEPNMALQSVFLTHGNVLFSCVNETMHLLGNLPFFKINVSCSMAWDDSPCVKAISKLHVVGEGPGETPSAMRCLSYLINSLLTDSLLTSKFICKLSRGVGHYFYSFLMSMSEALPISFIL